jgi:hypothetical protein
MEGTEERRKVMEHACAVSLPRRDDAVSVRYSPLARFLAIAPSHA